MEYISLHGYIKNTSSDTEVNAETESGQEDLTSGKEYIEPHKLGRTKELGEKQEC